MGQVSNPTLTCGNRGIKRYGADDQDKVFHLDRKQEIKIDDAIGVDKPVSEENSIDSGRRAYAWPHLIGHEQGIEDAAADNGNKIVAEKKTAAPAPLQITAEHPDRQHIEQKMKKPTVEELVGEKLPKIKLVQYQRRNQAKIDCQLVVHADANDRLNHQHGDIGD